MKYRHFLSTNPLDTPQPAPKTRTAPVPHRLPPILQFIAAVDPTLRRHLSNAALQTHLREGDAERVCDEITGKAMEHGYEASLSLHEIAATGMPSFPGQRVLTTLILIDLKPL